MDCVSKTTKGACSILQVKQGCEALEDFCKVYTVIVCFCSDCPVELQQRLRCETIDLSQHPSEKRGDCFVGGSGSDQQRLADDPLADLVEVGSLCRMRGVKRWARSL